MCNDPNADAEDGKKANSHHSFEFFDVALGSLKFQQVPETGIERAKRLQANVFPGRYVSLLTRKKPQALVHCACVLIPSVGSVAVPAVSAPIQMCMRRNNDPSTAILIGFEASLASPSDGAEFSGDVCVFRYFNRFALSVIGNKSAQTNPPRHAVPFGQPRVFRNFYSNATFIMFAITPIASDAII